MYACAGRGVCVKHTFSAVYYTLNFARPLRRRAASTLLPVAVAERTRKPCVVARFRFFGW